MAAKIWRIGTPPSGLYVRVKESNMEATYTLHKWLGHPNWSPMLIVVAQDNTRSDFASLVFAAVDK